MEVFPLQIQWPASSSLSIAETGHLNPTLEVILDHWKISLRAKISSIFSNEN
jgi:hypothetical protein